MTQGLWNPCVYRYTAKLLASLDPKNTVVHAHSWTRALSSSVLKAALDSGLPLVMTLHDYLMACPQGTFFRQREGCNCELTPMSLSCLSTNCDASGYSHKLWRVGRKFVQDKVGGVPRRLRNFIYVSESSLRLLKPYLPVEAECHYVPNPIEVERHEAAEPAKSEVFCFAGRFVPEKGAMLFAEAAKAEGVTAQFLGEGPQRDQIVQINPAAQMAGWMDSAGTLRELRAARALVFPSVWHEVLGLTVLEAAALGIPSIVPKGCGAEESVIDGETGLHFRSGDVADLAAKIALLKDADVAAKLGRAAYERFWSTAAWTLEAHVRNLEAVYTKMLR
jgi:glycosyltransferase involved in cell wall biosynthesis